MSSARVAASLPRLAYVYHPLSFAPLSITEAAAGVCSPIWILDGSDPDAAITARLLRKFGPVVDMASHTLDETAQLVQEHAPDGVLSMHDSDLLLAAELAARLELPFHSVETAQKLVDKHAQRAALCAAGLRVPDFRIIPAAVGVSDLARLVSGFEFPGVLKPRQGQASRNTLPVSTLEQLRAILPELRRHDAHPEDYVLEGYVADSERELGGRGFANFVSVETVVEDGRVEHATISARTPFLWPFRETGYFTPSALSEELQAQVLDTATHAVQALGVQIGCLHTEIKLTDDGPVVIEVNGRPGGGMSEMLERASGFSILRAALQLAVGAPVGLSGPVRCERVGYLLYVFPKGDVNLIDSVDGLATVLALDGVDEVVLVRGPGAGIDWREGSEAHVFHYAGTTSDHDQLRELMAEVDELVAIKGRSGATGQTATC